MKQQFACAPSQVSRLLCVGTQSGWSENTLFLCNAFLTAALLNRIRKKFKVMLVTYHNVFRQPLMSNLERLTRHTPFFHEGCLRQMVHIGMKLPMFFNMVLKVRIVEFLHHTFFEQKMLLKQAEELDDFGFGVQSVVIGRALRYSRNAVENALVLQIYRRYPKRIFVLPFPACHSLPPGNRKILPFGHQVLKSGAGHGQGHQKCHGNC